ncbi:Glycogen debranching enzyme [Pseudodesulfovibrio profundus]|uniref:Glycogen debranching enzyme n=1 Tax=Pseudodesulfovibrio profundus TaxID=57320 RepID=A0A2C8FDA6_9BACT|nr:amylo-alpha-1,6-glucosidase [Pseudodesulfovibrio profundus]SOB60477.1 Glycogen debranching enzyme [Pseudodesulfovibrio profundus]
MIRVPRDECVNTETATRKEWLDTNGIGGYASSTSINCHTRKYHGLLVAALKEPRGKFVLLSKVATSLVHNDLEFHLSTNKYPGVYHPTGHQFVEEFEQGLYPSITYRIGDALIRKSMMMVYGKNTTLLCYELLEGKVKPTLRIRPMLAYRDIHSLTRENMFLRPKSYPEKNGRKIQPYEGMPSLYMGTNRTSEFHPGPKWSLNVEYILERDRGFDYQEDLFCPGMFELPLQKGKPVIFAASTEPLGNLERTRKKELERREAAFDACKDRSNSGKWLKYFSDQFLIRNASDFASVVAGYHWFGEWGRDTMIALPGLTFHAGRREFGEEVLAAYAKLERNGLLPNYLDQRSEHLAYNSIDASLWFFWAVQEYLKTKGSKQFVMDNIYPALRSVVSAHLEGKVPLCGIGEDGLLYAGNENTQLTWMDAQAYGGPVTPRHGAAVEINALWYNALRFFLELAPEDDELIERANSAADNLAANFIDRFWNHADNCLSDVVNEHGQDHCIRPNQIFAVSLPYTMLNTRQMRAVISTAQSHLLTPYGLRTLSPRNPLYTPFYRGDSDERDSAYHQGMVWPWLAGHFGEALIRQAEDKSGTKAFLRKYFKPILRSFPDNFGIGSLPELYTGNPPHLPKGTIAQAWSVAEAIRLNKILGGR